MAQLTVRNVPERIVRALRIRAAQSGRSAEAEHRLILEESLKGEAVDFWDRVSELRKRSDNQRSESGDLQHAMRDER